MRISNTYPENAVKLYHIKPGQAFKITPDDGTVDNDIYIMTNLGIRGIGEIFIVRKSDVHTHGIVVSLSTGHATPFNLSKRGVVLDACVSLGGLDRD